MNLYVASHVHHLEGMGKEESDELVEMLYEHATSERFVVSIEWKGDGDLIMVSILPPVSILLNGYVADLLACLVVG